MLLGSNLGQRWRSLSVQFSEAEAGAGAQVPAGVRWGWPGALEEAWLGLGLCHQRRVGRFACGRVYWSAQGGKAGGTRETQIAF